MPPIRRRLVPLVLHLVALSDVAAWTLAPFQSRRLLLSGLSTRSSQCRWEGNTVHRSPHTAVYAAKTMEELLPTVREGIEEKGATQEWNACAELLAANVLVASGDSESDAVMEAEILLASALEWRGWARVTSTIARKYMRPKLPSSEQLQAALDWLRNGPLEMTDPINLANAIKESPTAYLVDPEAAYKTALETAPKHYKDPETFKALLMEDPSVLECSYNCADDGCNSNCGNCWVTYELKRG